MRYRYRISAVLPYLLLISLTGRAQSPRPLDSLTRYLRTAPRDSSYLRAQNEATFQLTYKSVDYARADSLTRQQEALAIKLNNWGALVEAYRNRASICYFKADYAQSLANFKKALQTAEVHNLPPKIVYGAMCNIAVGYDKLGQDEQVIQAALRAIQYQESHSLRPRQPVPHRLIGGALVKLGKGKEAVPYYREAGLIFKENGDQRGIAIFENQLGDFYVDLKQPQQAFAHYRASLRLAEAMQFELLQADVFDGLANAYRVIGQPAVGLPYALKALAIADKHDNEMGRSTGYTTIGLLYKAQKDYPTAEACLKKALTSAEKQGSKDDSKTINQHLADLYAEQQRYRLAYEFQSQKNRLIDSATTVRTNSEVQRLVARYETEKKEAQINLLRQEARLRDDQLEQTRFRTNALLAGGILLLLLGVAVSAWLLNRARLRRLEEALKLRQQIARDLHDEVGSTLSSISLLSGHTDTLLSQNRPESAQKMVQKIYADARQILESIDEIIWTINPGNDSLHRIALRLQEYAQPLMESRNILFSLVSDPALDDLPVSMGVRRNLYLIGKEAINNLVKYSQATHATVRFERGKDQIAVVIEDNGRGFDPAQLSTRNGQASMQQRAEAIGGALTVQSAVGDGTRLKLVVNG